jgi:hypothetical protein
LRALGGRLRAGDRRAAEAEEMNPILIADEIAFRVGTKVCDVLLSTQLGGACSDKTVAGYFAIAFIIIVLLTVFGGRIIGR